MPLFPIFLDLRGKKVLIVGGGHVALRKAERLAPYGASITAVAPEFAPGFAALSGVTALERRFQPGDVEGAAGMLVYTADIGRDVMTDPVWVFSDEILSFGEGDVLTIYVTVEGTSVDYDGQLLPAVRLWFYNE